MTSWRPWDLRNNTVVGSLSFLFLIIIFPSFLFCFIYLRLGTQETGNLESQMGIDPKQPQQISVFFS